MAGKDGRIDKHIPFNALYARLLQHGDHVANILTLKRGIPAKTGDKIAFQHAIFDVAFALKRSGKAKVRPQLQQGSQPRNHFLRTGGQGHLLAVVINLRGLGTDLLHHQGEIGAIGQLIDILVNVRCLDSERNSGGQSDDKSGKSHNLALTTRKQTAILRPNAL